MDTLVKPITAKKTKRKAANRQSATGRTKRSGTFSVIDRSILGMSVFDPAAREKRNMNRLIVTTLKVDGQEHRIKLICAIRLGADDLDCLLAIIFLAGKQGLKISASSEFQTQRVDIVDGLETKNIRMDPDSGHDIVEAPTDENAFLGAEHLRIKITLYALCKEMGLEHGGKAYDLVQERLERLRNVSYTDYGPTGGNSRRALSGARQTLVYFRYDELSNDELVVVLNARLSAAVLGKSFARVPLEHYRNLGSDTARILFVRLCAAVRDPGSLRVSLTKLVHWVYFDTANTASAASMRKTRVRKALEAVSCLPGWHVAWVRSKAQTTDEIIEIHRGGAMAGQGVLVLE